MLRADSHSFHLQPWLPTCSTFCATGWTCPHPFSAPSIHVTNTTLILHLPVQGREWLQTNKHKHGSGPTHSQCWTKSLARETRRIKDTHTHNRAATTTARRITGGRQGEVIFHLSLCLPCSSFIQDGRHRPRNRQISSSDKTKQPNHRGVTHGYSETAHSARGTVKDMTSDVFRVG